MTNLMEIGARVGTCGPRRVGAGIRAEESMPARPPHSGSVPRRVEARDDVLEHRVDREVTRVPASWLVSSCLGVVLGKFSMHSVGQLPTAMPKVTSRGLDTARPRPPLLQSCPSSPRYRCARPLLRVPYGSCKSPEDKWQPERVHPRSRPPQIAHSASHYRDRRQESP